MRIFNCFAKKTVSSSQQRFTDDMDKAQQEFIEDSTSKAERIVSYFNDKHNGAFDYNEKSLVVLDQLLDNFSNFGEMDDELKEDLIAQAGSYIFEVARRNYGGCYFWYDKKDQPILVTGVPSFEISLLAFEKVRMRLENGQEDNIPFFFKGYSERVRQAKPGDKALVV